MGSDRARQRGRRPRILRIITRLAVSGVSTHVTLANKGLTRRGWDTLLVHGRVQPDELEIDLPIEDVTMRAVPTLARPVDPVDDTRTFVELLRIIRAFRPDIVHTHHSKAGLLGRSAALFAGIPRVHTFHGHVFEGYFGARASSAIVATERLLATRTSRLIAISPIQRDDLLERGIGSPDRFAIVPLGLDLDLYRTVDRAAARVRLGIGPDSTAIVMIGRLVPIKRIDRLVRAFATVHARRPDTHLYIVGDGSERQAGEAQARAAGLADAVNFLGWRADTADWHGAADIIALSSDNEGTPVTLIEAAAAGRPVVSTAVGGVPDVVADGVTGILVKVDDEAGLANALLRLSDDRELAAQMGRAAPERAERYGIARLVGDLETIYRGILEQQR